MFTVGQRERRIGRCSWPMFLADVLKVERHGRVEKHGEAEKYLWRKDCRIRLGKSEIRGPTHSRTGQIVREMLQYWVRTEQTGM